MRKTNQYYFLVLLNLFFLYIFDIRFPKNRDIAQKWNSFLGFEPDKIIKGLICAEHFQDECFNHQKNKIELRPSSVPTIHPVPVQSTDAAVTDIASALENVTIVDPSSSSPPTTSHVPLTAAVTDKSDINSTIAAVSSIRYPIFPVQSTAAAVADIASAFENVTIVDPSSSPPTHVPLTAATPDCSNCMNCLLKDMLIKEQNVQINDLRKRLKKTQQKVWYLEKVKTKLNSALLELKEKSLLNEEQCNDLKVC